MLAIVALLAAACSSSASGQAGGPGSGGGTLNVGISANVSSLKPQPISGAVNTDIERSLYSPLFNYVDNKPQPGLVQSWSLSADRLTLVLNLRKNVKYSDGTPFNAAAALYTIRWMQKPETAAQGFADLDTITPSVTGPDQLTLKMKAPLPDIYSLLSFAFVVKPSAPNSGIGTGPFKVKSYSPGQSLDLVKNPHYWQPNLPRLDGINFITYKTPAAAALALRSGTIDMDIAVDLNQVKPLAKQGYPTVILPPEGTSDLDVNTSNHSLSSPLVRQALSKAFDRERYNKTFLNGLSAPAYSMWPPTSPVYSAEVNKGSFSLAKAKSLLNKAGVKSLNVTVTTATSNGALNEFLPIYQQDLATIGVHLKIVTVDPATLSSDGFSGNWPGLLTWGNSFSFYDPSLAFIDEGLTPGSNNIEHFHSAKYAAMVQEAKLEPDPAKRMQDYRNIATFIQEQAFYIPIISGNSYAVRNKSLHGLITSQLGVDYTNATLGAS